jgi:hypothetical protein
LREVERCFKIRAGLPGLFVRTDSTGLVSREGVGEGNRPGHIVFLDSGFTRTESKV